MPHSLWTSLQRTKQLLHSQLRVCLRADCLLCDADLIENFAASQPDRKAVDICDACLENLQRNLLCCSICALPITGSVLRADICGQCQTKHPAWDMAVATFMYEYPLDRLLTGLKYKRRLDYASTLANLMVQDLNVVYGFSDSASKPLPDCIVPVPLHPLREFQRGYNQAYLLAKTLSNKFYIPVRSDLLRRVRHTPRQSLLSQKQRKKNLRNAFIVNPKVSLPNYVALVDDVMTTGSTADVIATTLKKAGVERVDVWCCARAE